MTLLLLRGGAADELVDRDITCDCGTADCCAGKPELCRRPASALGTGLGGAACFNDGGAGAAWTQNHSRTCMTNSTKLTDHLDILQWLEHQKMKNKSIKKPRVQKT